MLSALDPGFVDGERPHLGLRSSSQPSVVCPREESPAKAALGSRQIQKGPETIRDLGAGVPTGTLTVFPGCAGLLIGFAGTLLDELVVP